MFFKFVHFVYIFSPLSSWNDLW